MPFDNLLIYEQCLLLLFCTEHNQYHLQTPNNPNSAVMPISYMLHQGKKRLTENYRPFCYFLL